MTVARMLLAAVCALMAGIAVENARATDTCSGVGCTTGHRTIASAPL